MAEQDLGKDIEAIRADLDALRKDLASVVAAVKDTAQSRADSEVEALQERLNKLADDVQAGGREGLRAVEQQIEERPLASLAIAFAVGMVLGRLFDRR